MDGVELTARTGVLLPLESMSRTRTALSEAIERLPDLSQRLADQKAQTRDALASLASYRDHVVLRELGRAGQLDLKGAEAVLDMDGTTTRRHMGRLVRAGKVTQGGNANKPTWSLPAKA